MTSLRDFVDIACDCAGHGYSYELRTEHGELLAVTLDRAVDLTDIHVDAVYRFVVAPPTDVAWNLCAITDRKHGTEGLLINAFDLLEGLGGVARTLHLGEAQTMPIGDAGATIPSRDGREDPGRRGRVGLGATLLLREVPPADAWICG